MSKPYWEGWRPPGTDNKTPCFNCGSIRDNHSAGMGYCPGPDGFRWMETRFEAPGQHGPFRPTAEEMYEALTRAD